MATFADSHCHLHLMDSKIDNVIKKSLENNTVLLCNVATKLQDSLLLMDIAKKYNINFSLGHHPCCDPITEPFNVKLLENFILQSPNNLCAIGETGLDFYHNQQSACLHQFSWFEQQIELAIQFRLPVIIHARNSNKETLKILKKYSGKLQAVWHCFTENWDTAKQVIDLGYYISLSGIVSFPKAKELHEVALNIDLNHLLIETDAPYLAPIPFRGKKNSPEYLKYIAQAIAKIRNTSTEIIAEHTTKNYCDFFKIKK